MKGGDYMIHVYVQAGKQFQLKGETECSPFIEIVSCGINKYTQVINTPCQSNHEVKWNEHLFIEPRNMHKTEISSQSIQISVKNRGFFKDELIGFFEFDIQTLYFSNEKHTIQHQWIALSNPSSQDFTQVAALLQVSISIQAEGDSQILLDETSQSETTESLILIPPTIKKEFKQLKIRFLQAEKLPVLDMIGTIDLFYQLDFCGKRWKSQIVTMKDNVCTHDIEFQIPLSWPLNYDRLVIKLFDDDFGKQNEIVGSIFFSLKKLVQDGVNGGFYSWYNVYGSPLDTIGPNTQMMNENPEFASTWKGRVLMYITCETSLQPEMSVLELKPEDKIRENAIAQGFLKEKQYQIIAEVESGIQLPNSKTKYTVKIQVGDFELQTNPATVCEGNYNQWLWRNDNTGTIFNSKFQNLAMIRHIYVYLMLDKKAVSFWQGDILQFEFLNPKTHWLVLKADKAIGIVDDDFDAGMISVKISLNDIAQNGVVDFQKFPAWSKKVPRRMNVTNIRLFIFQARDIPTADDNGLTDCFIKIWNYEGKTLQTEVVNETLHPIFYQAFDFAHQYQTFDEAPPIILNVWDKNPALKCDKFLGRCMIYLSEAASNPRKGLAYETTQETIDQIPVPKWHNIRRGNDDQSPICGQVLCSIVVAQDEPFKIVDPRRVKINRSVKTKIYNAQINILGLRELESFGIMPIRKPFIKFNIKSMLPPEKAIAVSDIQTDPRIGANPNFNTIITFSSSLPVEDIYCPCLTCDVYDSIFLGLRQPIIGSFTVQIGAIKSKCDEHFLLAQKTGKEILAMLKKHSILSIEEMQKLANDRMEEKMDPEIKIRLEERKQQLKFQRQTTSSKINFSKTKTVITDGKDNSQLQVNPNKEYQSFIDEENPSQKYQISQVQQSVNKGILTRVEQIQKEYDAIDKQLHNFATGGRRENIRSHNLEMSMSQALSVSLEIGIRKKLLESKQNLEEELKQQKEIERKLDLLVLKLDNEPCDSIKIPKYAISKQMENLFTEIDQPPLSCYKQVGYNDLPRIVKMMEGNDIEKREAQLRAGKTSNLDDKLQIEEEQRQSDLKRRTQRTRMHYRKYIQDELENCPQYKSDLFDRIEIFRGQQPSLSKSFFKLFNKKSHNGGLDDKRKVGIFKGMIELWNEDERTEHQRELKICKENIFKVVSQIYYKIHGENIPIKLVDINKSTEHRKLYDILQKCYVDTEQIKFFLSSLASKDEILKQLEKLARCQIHLYILEGYDFPAKDIGSESDPYLVVSCGDRTYNNRSDYKLNQRNPKFNLHYTFQGDFPGAPSLKIEVYDYDDLFGDDLIGTTFIDLDDRFYNPKWKALLFKPIEFRQMRHYSSKLSQGQLSCWVDIDENVGRSNPYREWELETEPIRDYQVRVCIMDTQDIPTMDFEGTSDVYIKAYINYKDQFQTDTHYRCMDGKASFNYRMLFDIKSPRTETVLVIQAYDRDLFTKNDYICEWIVDLKEAFNFVNLTQMTVHVNEKYLAGSPDNDPFRSKNIEFLKDGSNCFIVETNGPNGTKPKIRLDVRILTDIFAKECPAGPARNEPNLDPLLPPPIGRIKLTLDPCKMINQLVDKKTQVKIFCGLLWALAFILLIFMLPMIFSNFVSTFVIWLVGLSPNATPKA